MQNKWTTSVEKKDENADSQTPEKNNSKKIGLAMGIVGAVLVTAGAAPMLFGGSDNLTGDVTNSQQEAVDPLVALLSGGDMNTTPTTKPEAATPKPSAMPKTTIVPTQASAPQKQAEATPKPSTMPKATIIPTQASAPQKQAEATPETINSNTHNTDKTGEEFTNTNVMHNASALTNSVNVTTQNTTVTANENSVSVSTNNGNEVKTQVKPPRNIQTGLSDNMLLGLLFLLASGAFIVQSRKNA